VSAKEIVMRPSRFLVVVLVLLAALVVLAGSSPAQTVNFIHSFTGTSSQYPGNVTPAQGRDGTLYGTTAGLVGSNYGTIFKLTTTGAFGQLFTFDSTNGSQPNGGLTLVSDGDFYGTASSGGSSNDGVLFKTTPSGSYTVLHEFAGGSDGAVPAAPPIEGSDGSLYGTTDGNTTVASTIYKYERASGSFSTIYQFDQTHGQFVVAPLIQATDGNFYGTAYQGGASNCGTIFKVTPSGTLLWYYSFPCLSGGSNPIGPLVQAKDGNFYGTTQLGGSFNVGTVFKLSQGGVVSILYNFQSFFNGGADGSNPFAGLVQATDGKLYGSTLAGGTQNLGILFQITTTGTYKLLYSFLTGNEGPLAAPLQHTNGLLYGTDEQGGRLRLGSVYSLNMGLGPFITFVQATGKVSQTAQILGQSLTSTTSVTFNGVPATSFKVRADTFMTAVVPSGATTGPVVVTTPNGTLTSNVNFRVTN
jgi:uncharacterized repeat protein (TIGR03803 family)